MRKWIWEKLQLIPSVIGLADVLLVIGLVFLFMGSWKLNPAWAYLLVGGLVFVLGLAGSIFGVKRKP